MPRRKLRGEGRDRRRHLGGPSDDEQPGTFEILTHTHTHTHTLAFVCRHFNTNRRGSLHDVCVACGTNYGYDGVRVFVEQTERGCRGSKAGA